MKRHGRYNPILEQKRAERRRVNAAARASYYERDRTADRYTVEEVSLGSAGLAARPAIFDRETQRMVKAFRSSDWLAAVRLRDRMENQR